MSQRVHDRVKETTTTTGIGNVALLGAVTQFQAFSNRADFLAGGYIYYAIVGQTGTEWEVGKGYLLNATTLVRFKVFESSNADALVSFSAGTKDVFSTIPSQRIEEIFTKGQSAAFAAGLVMP